MKGLRQSVYGCCVFLFSHLVLLCFRWNTGKLLEGLISLTLLRSHRFPTSAIIPTPIASFLYLPAAASVMWKQFSQQLKTMKIQSGTFCSLYKSLVGMSKGGVNDPARIFLSLHLFHFSQHDIRLKWRIEGFVQKGMSEKPLQHMPE